MQQLKTKLSILNYAELNSLLSLSGHYYDSLITTEISEADIKAIEIERQSFIEAINTVVGQKIQKLIGEESFSKISAN